MYMILCGHKACGKTTLAKAYSQTYSCDFIDTDDLIIGAFQCSIGGKAKVGDIYQALGEQSFRSLESKIIQTLRPLKASVIATGGGALLDPNNVTYLKSLGPIIYLKLNHAILANRWAKLSSFPAFMHPNDNLMQHFKNRDALYQSVADDTIHISHQPMHVLLTQLHQHRSAHGK